MKLNKTDIVTEFKHIQIRELTDTGGYHRRTITCDQTLAEDEHQEVKDIAEGLWTDEVKSAWATFQAEQQAQREAQ